MTSLIKNQILKHLSKFAKNLSPDQIHLSALKGEGELKNLELNDQVLTELLELPSWLRLTKATCNRVSVRIQWTKLKSIPIHLSLDEVHVEVETCEDLRQTSSAGSSKIPSYATGGPYGYGEKIVDGITVTINSVVLTLKSHAFIASFQMSRILVESKSPTWKKADLRMTRVKDTDKGELLIFKELSWQTVRIEAKSTINDDLTPLRLITNQARCRITIKKKMSDCSVLGCRLVVILDDLLWVLTDDQLKAALHYADSLSGLLKRATEETQKVKGARKLQSISENQSIASKDKNSGKKDKKSNSAQQQSSSCVSAKVFSRYDVVETSYHFYSDRIDLHLCDDPGGKGRSCHPRLSEGGAFQVSFSELQVDFYPYHVINVPDDRSSWIRYIPGSVHASWLEQSLAQFQSALMEAAMSTDLLSSKSQHTPLFRSNAKASATSEQQINDNIDACKREVANPEFRNALLGQFRKLMTTNLIVRLKDFAMWKVSISKGKTAPKEFLSGDRQRYSLPEDMPVMHFEYTQFFYPGNISFPLPPPKLFAYFNPIQLTLDPLTVLWLNAFALNLQRSVKLLSLEQTEPPYLDVKVEAIMFRVVLDADEENFQHSKQKDRPKSLHIHASRILASNYRSLDTGTKADLSKCLDFFRKSTFYTENSFPTMSSDIPIICDVMVQHVENEPDLTGMLKGRNIIDSNQGKMPSKNDVPRLSDPNSLWPVMEKKLLWTESRDVWHVSLDPLWADFHGTPATDSRPIPLVDAFPFTMWLYKQPEESSVLQNQNSKSNSSDNNELFAKVNVRKDESVPAVACGKNKTASCAETNSIKMAKMHLLAQINSLVSLQLNHFQLLFLMRLLESIGEITTFLTQDVSHILEEEDESSMALGLVAPQVDISLLMPSISECRDNIGGDYDISLASYSGYNSSEGIEGGRLLPGNSSSTSIYSMGDIKSKTISDECKGSVTSTPPATLTMNSEATTPTPDVFEITSEQLGTSAIRNSNLDNVSAPSTPQKSMQIPNHQEAARLPPALPPRGKIPTSQIKANNFVINESVPNICSSVPTSIHSPGTPSKQQPTPAIQLSSPNGVIATFPKVGQLNTGSKHGNKKTSMGSGNNLTSSLSNMMSQLDTSIRGGSGSSSQQSLFDNDDSISYKSDDSGDSDAFVVVGRGGGPNSLIGTIDDSVDSTLFTIHSKATSPEEIGTVEFAAEVQEDANYGCNVPPTRFPSQIGASSTECHTTKHAPRDQANKKGVISVATFHLGRLELAQQSIGNRSCVKVQGASLSGEECPTISWEEFQSMKKTLKSKFSMRGKGWSESAATAPPSSWCFKLRFSTEAPNYQEMLHHSTLGGSTTMSLKEKISRSANAFLKVQAQNLPLQFYTSTLNGLVDLVEDEIIPTPIPMEVHLENIALHLIEDRPSSNITSPGSLPIDLAIPFLTITRDKTGLFSIQPSDKISECDGNQFTKSRDNQNFNVCASLPEVTGGPGNLNSKSQNAMSSMSHHLDLVRSGVASIETELQQRASLLAVDNANLRNILENSSSEVAALRAKAKELESTQQKLVKTQQQVLALDKENKQMKQTLTYLQQELIKSGKKNIAKSSDTCSYSNAS